MRILMTGAAGFLGSHLQERLQADGHTVCGVDNMLGGDEANIVGRCLRLDCCNLAQMDSLMADFEPEVVYHLAAAPHEGLSVFSPVVVTQHTYLSTVAVATAAVKHGVRRFLFASSMSRYGLGWGKSRLVSDKFEPFTETMPPRPVDPYGIAKVAAEDVLGVLCSQHGMELVIAVCHNIIGPKQKIDPYRNVATIFINMMLQGRRPYVYGDGEQRRVFSFVGDCIDPMVKMLHCPEGMYNIGPDENPVTINELGRSIGRIIGTSFDPVYLPARPREVRDAWPSADKARWMLGYDPQTTLEDGLRSMVDHIRKRGPKPFVYHLPLEIEQGAPATWRERLM